MNDSMSYSASGSLHSPGNVYGPRTAGQIFDQTFALLRENPGLFFGIGLVLLLIELLFGGVVAGSEFWLIHTSPNASPAGVMLLFFPIALLSGVLLLVLTQIIKGAIFFAARARLTGLQMTVGDACTLAMQQVGKIVAIAILVALRIIGYVLLFYFVAALMIFIPAIALGGLTHGVGQSPMHLGAGRLAGLGAAFLLLAIIGMVAYLGMILWLVSRYAVAIPAGLEEDLPATGAIRRSVRLSHGSKGRLLAVILAMFCFVLVVFAALVLPLQLTQLHAAAHSLAAVRAGGILLNAGISILANLIGMIATVFLYVAFTLCYFDLRVRKERLGRSGEAVMEGTPRVAPPLEGSAGELPVS